MSQPFHITITAGIANGLDLRHETSLVKSALLYADKVTLCSPVSSMMFSMLASTFAPKHEQIRMFRSLVPILCENEQRVEKISEAIDLYEKY